MDFNDQNRNPAPAMAPNDPGMFLDWDDVISNDGQEFVILPEGDYEFEVSNVERGRFPGGPKLPACNKVIVTLVVHTPEGIATAKTDLIMHRSLEWKICSFFTAIGLRKHGDQIRMDWKGAVGRHGMAHFKPRSYQKKNGGEGTTNDVDHFIEPSGSERPQGAPAPVPMARPAAAPATMPQPGNWVSQAEAQVNNLQAQQLQFGPNGQSAQGGWRNNQF